MMHIRDNPAQIVNTWNHSPLQVLKINKRLQRERGLDSTIC